jgi:hypothetical protein
MLKRVDHHNPLEILEVHLGEVADDVRWREEVNVRESVQRIPATAQIELNRLRSSNENVCSPGIGSLGFA